MLLIHGSYRCADHRTAYRKDWCLSCQAECHAEQRRAFVIGHLYGVPLLPLGFRRRWVCGACGQDPRVRTRESPAMLIVGVVVFSLMFLAASWPIIPERDAGTIWGARVVLLGLAVLCAWMARMRLREPTPERHVTPYAEDACHYCHGALVPHPEGPYCAPCRVHLWRD